MAIDPLAQLEREPSRAYERLLTFANLGPGRSLKKAADVAGCSESTLRAHARDWQWAERIGAFDRQQLGQLSFRAAQDSTEAHLAALGAYRDQQLRQSEVLTEAAEALLAAALRTLATMKKQNVDLPPTAVGPAMQSAARLLDTSSNQLSNHLAVEELLKAMDERLHLDD